VFGADWIRKIRAARSHKAGNEWAKPSEELAALLIREIYTNREEALANATMARKEVAVSHEAPGNRVRQKLEEILGEKQRWPNSP
jgi:hypothetical protein